MIIRLRSKEILEEKGKSNYWLSQQLGMCYRNYHNIVTNKTSAVRFETLGKLCVILEDIGQTEYWLFKQMNMSNYSHFQKIIENRTSSIRFDTLVKLSQILEVPVGELFQHTE